MAGGENLISMEYKLNYDGALTGVIRQYRRSQLNFIYYSSIFISLLVRAFLACLIQGLRCCCFRRYPAGRIALSWERGNINVSRFDLCSLSIEPRRGKLGFWLKFGRKRLSVVWHVQSAETSTVSTLMELSCLLTINFFFQPLNWRNLVSLKISFCSRFNRSFCKAKKKLASSQLFWLCFLREIDRKPSTIRFVPWECR